MPKATKGKPVTMYIEENICYGRDPRGKNKMLYAFQPLAFVEYGDFYSVVKPKGRGNYRHFLIKTDLLQFR